MPCAAEPPCLEGGGKRRAVDQCAPRGIDQQCIGLHQAEFARTDETAGCVVERAMQGNNVRDRQELIERHTTGLRRPARPIGDA